ncbi:BZ3500_MvSof-1268-A1-R1_Chr1-1g01155 [Microbotryum saponariae]|uniref:BZ3500_MvSof-1268-A1-R1_Chr1-1g01155 protein n=1 Tax=Microbotryum saponariae TaxID=289078 RepID=A0A2X0KD28_9BASI|nr:BZ3500_MvSof-1268-A1-R1_Chr1-1g01155 [Microbotryum saponariae]SCZ93524.1 BZ3501_MvSof-1269-A2-R1_Chr1-1g00752 [Microbotryum saponariae]
MDRPATLSGSPPHKISRLSGPAPAYRTTHASTMSTSPTNAGPPPSSPSFSSSQVTAPSSASTPAAVGRKRLGLTTGLEKATVKKLVLKATPRATPPPDPSIRISQAIVTLTRAARAILTVQPTPESLQALYGLCQQVVVGGASYAQELYDRLKLELERASSQLRRDLVQIVTPTTSRKNEEVLAQIDERIKQFLDQTLLIRSVFLYLDRAYVLPLPTLLGIWELGLDILRHSVLADEAIAERITSALINLIVRERDGEAIPRALVQSVVTALSTISTQSHLTLFVAPFLASSRTYYEAEGVTLSSELNASSFLRRVNQRLSEEAERCDSGMVGVALKGDVLRVVLDEMVKNHVEAIATKQVGAMVSENRTTDLSSLYSLLSRISALPILRNAFLEHFKATGLAIVLDKEQDDKMVINLIALRNSGSNIVEQCFAREQQFSQAISSAFEFFINKRENKPAEMIAKFLDAKLRSGNKSMGDAEFEKLLNDVLFLFRFTQGKDIFEAFYKRDLAKRLLLNKSASFDAERSMLLKLKDECGAGFTQKLELMFKDIELSEDIMRAYADSSAAQSCPFDLSVNVLSTGNWPAYLPTTVTLPSDMASALDKFKVFYQSKHQGRALTWAHALDYCSLRAKFPKGGRKELSVSLFQTVILLLFNDVADGAKLGFNEIVEATRLDPKEAARTLQSLACGKVRVLQKHPKGRDVNPTDQFSFNKEFKDDHIKIKINQIQQKETAEENKSTTDRVFTDRSSHLQLAIVRIMKARKTLKYTELVMEVVTQIGSRFKVETSEIKKAISSLMDREYMRRSETEQNVFEYVA